MRNELKCQLIPLQNSKHDLNNILIIDFEGKSILGKKNINDYKKDKLPISLIDKNVILGFFQGFQFTSDEVLFYFFPIEKNEKNAVFKKIITSFNPYIYYLFPILDNKFKEQICENEYWNNISLSRLNHDEIHFRNFSTFILKKFNLKNKIFYDPACSSGKFLSEIKEKYPEITTIGSDISEVMIDKAKNVLDKTFISNARHCSLPDGFCDFLIIRFLNAEVMSTKEAYEIFDHLQKKVKSDNGFIIIFGHTSILLNIPYISSKYNLTILNTIGHLPDKNKIFPYFILKRSCQI